MKSIATTAIGLLFCGSAFAETHVVEAYSMTFVPDQVTVVPGDVIRWEYVTGYPHDVTSGTKCAHDGYLYLDIPDFPGGSVEWTVPEDAPSEIPYFCELHCGNGMTGLINVEGDGLPEDVNGDGVVDVSDLLEVVGSWGESGVPSDINGDGVVDVIDLLAIIGAWGANSP